MKNLKTFLIIVIFISSFFSATAQPGYKGKCSLMLDLVGNSGFYSLNGEVELKNFGNYKLNARVGVGYLPINGTESVSVPVGINILSGSKSHHLELGLGASYIKGLCFLHAQLGTVDKWYANEGIYFVPSIGYRFDKLTGGLILKVNYSPLISLFDTFNKEKFVNEVVPVLPGNMTKMEYWNMASNGMGYPQALTRPGNFGVSIGYRF